MNRRWRPGSRSTVRSASLNAAIRDIRSYILDLRPHQLYDESLMEGIQRLILEFKVNTSCEVYLQGPASGLDDLGKSQALALFHICQEALANIAKHAHAKKVEVILWLVQRPGTAGDQG